MLKTEIKDKLKSIFKMDVDKLIAAITATEEVDFELPAEVTLLTNADLSARDENKIREGKAQGETIGETKGREIAVKKMAKKMGLDEIAIGNDIDKLEAAAQTKFKAGDAGLQAQVDGLLKDKETLSAEITTERTKAQQATFDATLISMFPANRTSDLKDNERLMLLKNELQFETVDGKTVVKRNGQLMQDAATHAPLAIDKVLSTVFTDRKWVGAASNEGGRGGSNSATGSGTGGIKKLSAYSEKWIAENPGKNAVSPEFDAALATHVKANTDFDYNA
jgi:hypothetical protein